MHNLEIKLVLIPITDQDPLKIKMMVYLLQEFVHVFIYCEAVKTINN
jgi:hypothetical protein